MSRIRRMLRTVGSVAYRSFPGSRAYWEARYAGGGDSGAGSYGRSAQLKAAVVNDFVARHNVQSVIEFGCGDGNQLSLFRFVHYKGFDVSPSAVALCRQRFASDASKSFALMKEYRGEKADLALSLDVLYHLVEDDVFQRYMATLFAAARQHVIIYSTNTDSTPWYVGRHIKRRRFSTWVDSSLPAWRLLSTTRGYDADFFFYEKAA